MRGSRDIKGHATANGQWTPCNAQQAKRDEQPATDNGQPATGMAFLFCLLSPVSCLLLERGVW